MDEVIVELKYKLVNGETHVVKIRDVDPSSTQTEISALGNSLISKKGHYNNVQFESLLQSTRIVTSREVF